MRIPTLIRAGWSCLLWCLLLALPASAQFSVTDFSNRQLHTAITRDKHNNIYAVFYSVESSQSIVVKYLNGNSGNQQWIYTSPTYTPEGVFYWGIAVNATGDVYFTASDGPAGMGRIVRLRFDGTNYQEEVVRSGFSASTAYINLAFDQQENLIVMEEDVASGKARLMRYNKGNESGAGTVLYEMQDNMMMSYPTGLAVDKNNTIYFTGFWDASNKNSIYQLKSGETTPTKHGYATYTSLTCDDAGYLYAVDAGYGSGASGQMLRFEPEMKGGSYFYSGISATISVTDGMKLPWGILVDRTSSAIYYNQFTAPGIRKLTAMPLTVTEMSLMNTSPANTSSVRYKVAFSPALTGGLPKEAFSVSTTGTISGAAITQVQPDLGYHTVDVSTGTGDGTLALVLTGNNMMNPVNSAPVTGAAYTIDRTSPSGTLMINNGAAYTNNTNVTLAVTASDVSPDVTMAFSNDAAIYSAAQPVTSPVSWTLPPVDGKKTVYMKVKDLAGNYQIIQKDITLDTRAPLVTITTGPPMTTSGTQAAFAFMANESASFEARLDGSTPSATTSPLVLTGISVGAHVLEIRATDPAGNQSAWKSYSWTVETLPVVTGMSVPVNGNYNAGTTLDFTVQYDKPVLVTGSPYIPLKIGAANVQAMYTGGTGTNELSFRYTVVPGDEATDGISTGTEMELNGGTILSAGGGNASLSLNGGRTLGSVRIHTLAPSVFLSVSQAQVNKPFTLTINFSEAVIGLTKEEILISNGEVSNLTGSNTLYVATVSNFSTGPIQISLPAGVAVNGYNTGNTASNILDITADVSKPVVSYVAVPPNDYYHVGNFMSFEVVYLENVTVNTTLGDPSLAITIGSTVRQVEYRGLRASNRLVFEYPIAPGDEDMDGITIGALDLNGATIRDAADNDADLTLNNVGNTAGVRVNTTPVTCVLSTTKTAFNKPFLLTLSFSEPIVGLTVSDLNILNTTVSGLTTVNDSTFTMSLNPTREQTYPVYLPTGAVTQKVGGNINFRSNTLNFTWDVTPPKVSSVAVPSDGYYRTGTPLDFYVTMDEPVTLTGRPTLPVIIGSKTVLADYISNTSGTILLFRYVVQDGDADLDGIAVGSGMSLNNGNVQDAAGNDAVPVVRNVGNTSQVFVHTAVPSVTLSTTAVSPLNHNFTVTATFSEKTNGLSATGFTATNADISNLQTADNITYTVLVEPRNSGAVSITLPANAATNIAGTGNTASNTLNLTYDKTPPAVAAVDVPSADVYAAGRILNFAVRYDEPVVVTGTPSLTLTLGSTPVTARYIGTGGGNTLFFVYHILAGDMDPDGITVDAIQLNAGTIKDAVGNNADLTLRNIPSTTGILVNTGTPAVNLSTAAAVTNSSFTVTVTFSEPVKGFNAGSFQVTNATVSNLVSVNSNTYAVTITPTTDGAVIIQVPGGIVTNNANTPNTASNLLNVIYDNTGPEINSVMVPGNGYYREGQSLDFTVNLSEAVLVSGTPSIPVIIGGKTVQATYAGGIGTRTLTFRYVVQNGDKDTDGIALGAALQLNGGSLKDVVLNDARLILNNVASTSQVFVNTEKPTVTLSTSAAIPVTGVFPLTIAFSEAVTGFTLDDLQTTNATVTQLQTSDNITYTVQVTPGGDGPVAVQVPAGGAKSRSGNDNLASNVFSIQADMTAPVVTSVNVPSPGYYNAGQQLNFTVQMSEPVTATAATQVIVFIGSVAVPATLTGGTGTDKLTFSCTIVDGFMDMDGITLGAVLTGSVKDLAGNSANATLNNIGNTSGVFVNTQHPTVSVTTTARSPVRQPFPVTITFSEAVTGFTDGGIRVTNGTASTLQTTDNITYTTTITPAADGTVTVHVPAGAAQNVGRNDNIASNTISLQAKVTVAVVARVDVPANGYYTAGQPLNFKVVLSEPVAVTGTPSIPVIIGTQTVQATYTGGTGTATLQFSYTVQNGDMDMNGIALGTAIQLNGGTLKDMVGNNANLVLNNAGNTSGVFVNTQRPSVAISTSAASPVRQAFPLTITFSEAVTGFALNGITASNATLSQLQTTDNITYTVLVTPSADGNLTLFVPAGVAQNIADNDNQASNTILLTADITVPVVTGVNVPGNGYYKAGQPLTFSVVMSERVTVTGTPSIPVIIGTQTVQAAYTGGTGTATLQFSYTVQNGDMDMNGIALGTAIEPNGGTLKDMAGNNANLVLNNAGNTSGVFVNTQRPSVAISTSAASPVRQAFPLTVTFSEAVTGFALNGLTATNATLSQLQTTDNITYTVLVTPSADGTLTLFVPAGAAQNIAGNGNQASNTITLLADITTPVVNSVSSVPANGYYKAGQPLNFSVVMSEPVTVTGTPSILVIIGTQTVQATYIGGTGTATLQFLYIVQQGDMDLDGISVSNAIALNGGALKDAAGNDAAPALHRVPATNAVLVKTNRPAVTLSSTSSGRINTPFAISLTFTDPVRSLAVAALQVSNGVASQLQTTDNIHYTAVITPAADGNVTVQLPADVASDNAGNGNLASNQLSLQYDATAPAIGQQSFDIDDNSPAGALVGQLQGTDASGIVKDWKLMTDGSGGALFLDANGRITVKDNALLRVMAGKIITLQVTVSDGLNTSTAVPVTVKVRVSYVNKQPVMDPVADVYLCATTGAQTIQLTGVSPVEPDQHYTISLASSQPYFDVLQADVATNTIRYQLKPGIGNGAAAITITLKDDGGTDNGGKDTYSQTFYLTVNPLPGVSISSNKGGTISKGDIVTLTATGAAAYSWKPASGTSGSLQEPTLTIKPAADATYEVTGTSAAGCSAVATITIRVTEDYQLDATNLLTPNGDGKNDRWIIRNLDSYPDNEVKIFDRAGRLVYQRRNYSNDWDGTLNGHPLAEGTYYYVLTVNGTSRTWKGFITIIRNDQ